MTKEEIAERLKIARLSAGFQTAGDAATSLGVPYQTYASHENGGRAFDTLAAVLYARRFRVSTDWLLSNKGPGPAAVIDGPHSAAGRKSEIRMALESIPELENDDIVMFEAAIQAVVNTKPLKSKQTPSDGQREPAIARRVPTPSQQR